MTPNLVILCGTARCGKSTVAGFIRESLAARGEAVREAPLALQVKQELSSLLGVPVADQEAQRASWRIVWQVWGTEVRRRLSGEHYWLRKWERAESAWTGHLIVPDVRFPNEIGFMAQFAQQRGMVLRAVQVRRSLLWEASQWTKHHRWHESERAWRRLAGEFPWLVVNNGPIERLRSRVEAVVAWWL